LAAGAGGEPAGDVGEFDVGVLGGAHEHLERVVAVDPERCGR
jgi:hypothetical protein